MIDYCVYCGEEIEEGDDKCYKRGYFAHVECAEIEDPDDIE